MLRCCSRFLRWASCGIIWWAAAEYARAQGTAAIDFNRDIRPILSNHCYRCHGPDENQREAGLRLDQPEAALAELESGSRAVVPGDPDRSELVRRIMAGDPDERMPPPDAGKELTPGQMERLAQWIRDGAPFARHWSYVRLKWPPLPQLKKTSWPQNPIDRFVLARLETEGLEPSPPADRHALIRRLSLDLTGLPPTSDEVESFVSDPDPDAHERLVDRLLSKPAFGEHWARKWLDLARYADSAGYADDPPRTIWAYRDWVIGALNANRPFDQFTIEQLAGDLLPDPDEDRLIATAFHRNTLTNNEGGTSDEEFRNAAIVDRVNTTMAAWMGTTIACAQCHSHKFDPISQEEFFGLFAVLNNTEDADHREELPILALWTPEQERQKAAWRAEISGLGATEDQPQAKDRIKALDKLLTDAKPFATVPILRELPPGGRRKTFIQHRGNFLDTGREVRPHFPSAFHPWAEGGPIDRLALARWLTDGNNPLTARVIANRYWEAIFGRGIVATSEEFGSQGELPTHPELLDWLARDLIGRKWDIKAFLKMLVSSATYQQSSRVTEESLERDPDNVLLARGPRVRLSAEMVRDQALCVAGLLSPKLYGPPVKPPQPALGVSAAFGSGIDWQPSDGEDRYRRGLYTTWRRSNPYPSMVTFDAPNREVCTIRRSRTNTPLQALVTLNDPVYVEAAQALARQIASHAGTTADKVQYGFERCVSRPPASEEGYRLVQLYEQAFDRYFDEPVQALQLATSPLGPVPEGSNVAELAAWTVVGNVLLNLDEMFMKR